MHWNIIVMRIRGSSHHSQRPKQHPSFLTLPWGRLCLLSVGVGLASVASLSLSIFLALYAGILISIWIWFAPRPHQWWYDMLFFASLLCASVLSSVLFVTGCAILNGLSLSSNACNTSDFATFVRAMMLLMFAPGIVLWGMTYIRLYFAGRRRQPSRNLLDFGAPLVEEASMGDEARETLMLLAVSGFFAVTFTLWGGYWYYNASKADKMLMDDWSGNLVNQVPRKERIRQLRRGAIYSLLAAAIGWLFFLAKLVQLLQLT